MAGAVVFRFGGNHRGSFEPARRRQRGAVSPTPHPEITNGSFFGANSSAAVFPSFANCSRRSSLARGRGQFSVFCRAAGAQPKGASDEAKISIGVGQDRLKKVHLSELLLKWKICFYLLLNA